MFGLFRPSLPELALAVFKTRRARDAALLADVKRHRAEGRVVFVATHFGDSTAGWARRLEAEGLAFEEAGSGSRWNAEELARLRAEGRLVLLETTRLLGRGFEREKQQRGPGVALLCAESYPLAERGQLLRGFVAALPEPVVDCEYESLDSPLFVRFGGERVAALLERLGLGEDERIEHRFVRDSLGNMQKKLARKVAREHRTGSVEAWFAANVGAE